MNESLSVSRWSACAHRGKGKHRKGTAQPPRKMPEGKKSCPNPEPFSIIYC